MKKSRVDHLIQTYKDIYNDIQNKLSLNHHNASFEKSFIEGLVDERMIEIKESIERKYRELYDDMEPYYNRCYAIVSEELDEYNKGNRLMDELGYNLLVKEAVYWENKLNNLSSFKDKEDD